MTVAVTRARVLRWLRLESSGDGGSNQSAAVLAGLKQGSAGWSGHGCGRTGTQGTAGRGECKVAFWLTPSPAYIEPTWAAEGSLGHFRYVWLIWPIPSIHLQFQEQI